MIMENLIPILGQCHKNKVLYHQAFNHGFVLLFSQHLENLIIIMNYVDTLFVNFLEQNYNFEAEFNASISTFKLVGDNLDMPCI